MRHYRVALGKLPLVLLLGCLAGRSLAFEVPMVSTQGLYQGHLSMPALEPPLNQPHDWFLHLSTRDGETFVPGQIRIRGGMPGHGHGFPTEPKITRYLGDDRFLLQGVQFNMRGRWQLSVTLSGPLGLDTLVADFRLGRPMTPGTDPDVWTEAEVDLLKTMHISRLPTPADPSNRLLGNDSAITLGSALFFDPRLSRTGKVSCATCHHPDKAFTDGRSKAMGSAELRRNAPSLIGAAHWRWYYWDGRRDSLWAQALTPMETAGEMDSARTDVVRTVFADPDYRAWYRSAIGEDPGTLDPDRFPAGAGPYADVAGKAAWHAMDEADRRLVNQAFAHIGKAIAAFEWTLRYSPSRFDRFVDALATTSEDRANPLLTEQERQGLKLFINDEKTHCLRCHNGPLLSNAGFHNIGTGTAPDGQFDFGRVLGIQSIWYDAFNCLGDFSDAPPEACLHLQFAPRTELPSNFHGAFKVPSLRNVANTAPYFHDGRLPALGAVLAHYRNPPAPEDSGHELPPLLLNEEELAALAAFLRTL